MLQTDNRPDLLRYILRVQIVAHAVNLLLQDRVIFTAYMPSYSYQKTIIRSFIKDFRQESTFCFLASFQQETLSLSWTLSCRGISADTCGLDNVFPPGDLGSGPYTQCIIYVTETSSFQQTYTYQKLVWSWRCVAWYDTVILSCLVSNVYFNCIVQDSLYHDMDIGTIWHCALVSCTPSQSIERVFGCALVWC